MAMQSQGREGVRGESFFSKGEPLLLHTPKFSEVLYQTGYVSTQTHTMSAADLAQIKKEARGRNKSENVTGLLLHRKDSFFQVLEGSRKALDKIMALISNDPRHQRIKILFDCQIEEREFADWSMAFKKLDDDELHNIPELCPSLARDPEKLFSELTRTKKLVSLFHNMG